MWAVTAVIQDNDPREVPMTITIAGIAFDYPDYDERGDSLFLHVGPPNGRSPRRSRRLRGIPSNTTSAARSSGWS
jgi:hypothetical protein